MKLEIIDSEGRIVQSVDLLEGEYRLRVQAEGAAVTLGPRGALREDRRRRVRWIVLSSFLYSLWVSWMVLESRWLDFGHDSGVRLFKVLAGGTLATALLVMVIVLMNKGLSHRFRFWPTLLLVLGAGITGQVIQRNLFGARWWLPSPFWLDEVYRMFIIIWGGAWLWLISGAWFERLGGRTRAAVMLTLGLLVVAYSYLDYLPFRSSYKYLTPNTPPPRMEWMESAPIGLESFLTEIQLGMETERDASSNFEELKSAEP